MTGKLRYDRNRPAISEEQQAQLGALHAGVVGLGALGGLTSQLLARLGVGTLTIMDPDVFEESNLNRQVFSDESVLGRSKAEVTAASLRRIRSDVELRVLPEKLVDPAQAGLFADCDVLFDCVDNLAARMVLGEMAHKLGIPLVHGALGDWAGQAALLLPDANRMPQIYPRGADTVLPRTASLPFMASMVASWEVTLFADFVTGRQGLAPNTLYYLAMEGEEKVIEIPLG